VASHTIIINSPPRQEPSTRRVAGAAPEEDETRDTGSNITKGESARVAEAAPTTEEEPSEPAPVHQWAANPPTLKLSLSDVRGDGGRDSPALQPATSVCANREAGCTFVAAFTQRNGLCVRCNRLLGRGTLAKKSSKLEVLLVPRATVS
jgi:hypothetical protein